MPPKPVVLNRPGSPGVKVMFSTELLEDLIAEALWRNHYHAQIDYGSPDKDGFYTPVVTQIKCEHHEA